MSRAHKRFLSIGECMAELAPAGQGLLRMGFAGDTFNTAWYARKLLPTSWQVDYLTALGDDPMSTDMRSFMQSQGVGTSAIRTIPGKTPGLYLISLHNGERSFTYWRSDSAARQLAADHTWLKQAIEQVDALYVSGITLAILPPHDAITLIDEMARAKAHGRLVAFDPNFRERLWKGRADMAALVARTAGAASLILPSFDDEQKSFGDKSPEETATRYANWGNAGVVVKNGASGAEVFWKGIHFHQPASKATALMDTTGAGDSFNAGFMAAILQGKSPQEAAQQAAHVSAQVVAASGALVSLAELV